MFVKRLIGALALMAVAVPLVQSSPASAFPNNVVKLTGHGFGHGRGLSQYGSLGYALAGVGYNDIIQRYYGNTSAGSVPTSSLIGVRIVAADNVDLIVTAANNFTVGTVAVPGGTAARVRKIGSNNFAVDTAANCAGGGGWVQRTTATGNIVASPPSYTPGNDLNLMIQRCAADVRAYRGDLVALDDGTMRTINNVAIDQYLRGVVPRESPASWGDLGNGLGINALRAQSIAARSYAYSSPAARWTTCDTTACQVYGGAFLNNVRIEDNRSDAAIADTAGQVRMLGGAVARTEFSSSSGGYTAGGTFPAIIDDGDATNLNPNHNWSADVPVATVEAAYPGIGSLNSIGINSRNGLGDLGGRVLSMTLNGSAGSVTTNGADFRAKLGLKSDWFAVQNTPSGGVKGYWMVGPDGGVYAFGSAPFFGSAGGVPLQKPVLGLAARTDQQGYWLVAADGGIFTYGAARFLGSTGGMRLNQPVVGMAAKSDNNGYWIVARDGGIFSYGSAAFHGSTGGMRLNQPVNGMAATPSGNGYWLVASDGGIFTFGDAKFFGSTGSIRLAQPIVGMASTPSGNGYWLVAADGGVFTFGDAAFKGSLPGSGINAQVTGISATKTGQGYVISTINGNAYSYGDAPQFGGVPAVVPGFKGAVLGITNNYE